jgi:hypothetical protein
LTILRPSWKISRTGNESGKAIQSWKIFQDWFWQSFFKCKEQAENKHQLIEKLYSAHPHTLASLNQGSKPIKRLHHFVAFLEKFPGLETSLEKQSNPGKCPGKYSRTSKFSRTKFQADFKCATNNERYIHPLHIHRTLLKNIKPTWHNKSKKYKIATNLPKMTLAME